MRKCFFLRSGQVSISVNVCFTRGACTAVQIRVYSLYKCTWVPCKYRPCLSFLLCSSSGLFSTVVSAGSEWLLGGENDDLSPNSLASTLSFCVYIKCFYYAQKSRGYGIYKGIFYRPHPDLVGPVRSQGITRGKARSNFSLGDCRQDRMNG